MAGVAAASLDIRPRRHIGRKARFRTRYRRVQSATLYQLNCFPELVREAGFDPAISCFQGRRITKLSHSLFGGAHGRTRTSIFNSDYGSPVRSRRRLRARGRAGGPRSRVPILRGSYPVQLGDGPRNGSPTRTRTWIDRLTAGRPTVGRSGTNWWTAG